MYHHHQQQEGRREKGKRKKGKVKINVGTCTAIVGSRYIIKTKYLLKPSRSGKAASRRWLYLRNYMHNDDNKSPRPSTVKSPDPSTLIFGWDFLSRLATYTYATRYVFQYVIVDDYVLV